MPASSSRVRSAALAGYACSMRSTSGPAALALRGRVRGRLRTALLVAAVGELVVDKLPFAPNRTEPPAWAGRIITGAITGAAVAGPAGAGAAGLAAGAGTYVNFRLRGQLPTLLRRPDAVIALGEDAICLAALAFATRRPGR